MKWLILLIPLNVMADVSVFGGFFAFDDNSTVQDYEGLSPHGYYGIKYTHEVNKDLDVSVGLKHESSTGYREQGNGFNGVFTEFNLRL